MSESNKGGVRQATNKAESQWDAQCQCGHKHSEHHPINSVNYSAGYCTIGECRCKGFIHQPEFTETRKQKSITEAPQLNCGMCGGVTVVIRGRNPGNLERMICPTCTYERLEQINEISSPYYGKTYQNLNHE